MMRGQLGQGCLSIGELMRPKRWELFDWPRGGKSARLGWDFRSSTMKYFADLVPPVRDSEPFESPARGDSLGR
jgi:hypothetical protein